MNEVVRHSTARSDFTVVLLTAFAGASLLLAGIGGLLAFSVRQRRRGIGIRVALGATPDRVAKIARIHGQEHRVMEQVLRRIDEPAHLLGREGFLG